MRKLILPLTLVCLALNLTELGSHILGGDFGRIFSYDFIDYLLFDHTTLKFALLGIGLGLIIHRAPMVFVWILFIIESALGYRGGRR
jgi:hypothetical protein